MNKTNISMENALNVVRSRKYIVGSVDEYGQFSISKNPVVHDNLMLASQEAARLARANHGKAFVTMQLTGGAFVPTVQPIFAL